MSGQGTLGTRQTNLTAKGRQRKAGLKNKLGLDDSDDDKNNSNNDIGDGNSAKAAKKARVSGKKLESDDVAAVASMDQAIPTLPGANLLFKGQKKKGPLGTRLEKEKKFTINSDTLQQFRQKLFKTDPLFESRQELLQKHLTDMKELVYYSIIGYNILFHGVGDKSQLLRLYSHKFDGEDVLEIDGKDSIPGAVGSDLIMKALLKRIYDILGLELGTGSIDVIEAAKIAAGKQLLSYI